jgi:DNA-binding helix-hairpin-helix protein with protein kinase domain
MRVRLEGKAQDLTLEGPLLGRGGEASIYAVPGRTDLAAKIYHHPTVEQASKLAAMLAAPPVAPPQRGQHVCVAWPIGRLLEPEGEGRVIGCLIPRLEPAHLIWEIYNPGVRREICPHFHYGSLLRTARHLAAAVQTLHACGYVLGDLNESNVLVTPQALVSLIDTDSFQVPGGEQLYRCRVGRPDYSPPELQNVSFAAVDRLPQHDNFALAVLIFQLLMHGIHPFAGTSSPGKEPETIATRIAEGLWPYSWTRTISLQPSPHAPPWCVLPLAAQDLFQRCFDSGHEQPELRPSAAEWQTALEEAEQQLLTCTHNSQHLYSRGLDVCPWCQGRSALPAPPLANRPEQPRTTSQQSPKKAKRVSQPVDDPLPPRNSSQALIVGPSNNSLELTFQALGQSLERHTWLIWMGMTLMGIVAGILYALERAQPGGGFTP